MSVARRSWGRRGRLQAARAGPAKAGPYVLPGPWRRGGRGEVLAVLLVDGCPDLGRGDAPVEEGHRVARHVDADGAVHPVLVKGSHLAVRGPRLDEAVVVTVVTNPLATAVAGDVLQDLGMPGGEFVDLLDDSHRPRRLVGHPR